ncbi:hypothetical protein [Bacillus solimangrovi]|uniref:Uncharacterized protein n=1 Tax=Bacillus solimangrovi TaxID=1305675 RepID=A0A1E5LJE3_9BACI|nr:hypothetical protein [Bacillus solimangrovi]OEH94195.1 hypothetical protein BFG57_09085 [Bacillus solimangrovi]
MNWTLVEDKQNLEELSKTFGFFHDSCIKELYMWTGSYVNENLSMNVPSEFSTNVRILFQRQYRNPSAIELVFEGVTQFHITPQGDGIILGAKLMLHDGLFYWADDSSWELEQAASNKYNWIAAKSIKWREVSSWIGEENRYGVIATD